MFFGNREIQKYYWQDFSLQRILIVPLMIFALMIFAYFIFPYKSYELVVWITSKLYLIFIFLWGGYAVAGAVVDELRGNTWDQQRLSAVTPWQLCIGKLFGSTLYAWYVGGSTLMIYGLILCQMTMPIWLVIQKIGLVIVSGVLCHTLTLLTSLRMLDKTARNQRFHKSLYLLVGLVGAYIFYSVGEGALGGVSSGYIEWFSKPMNSQIFILSSLVVYFIWTCTGLYRTVQEKLKFRLIPWVWVIFLTMQMVYCAGFYAQASQDIWQLQGIAIYNTLINLIIFLQSPWGIAFFVGLILTYISLSTEDLDVWRYKVLLQKWRERYWLHFFEMMPMWAITLILLFFVGFFWIVQVDLPLSFQMKLFVLSLFLFAIRDISVVHCCIFSSVRWPSFLLIMFYFVAIYLAIPVWVMSSSYLQPHWFYPVFNDHHIFNIVPIGLQSLLALWCVHRCYQYRLQSHEP